MINEIILKYIKEQKMFCLKCGKELSDEAVFCQYCGQKMVVAQSELAPITAEKQVDLMTPTNNLPTFNRIKRQLTSDEVYCRSCGNIIRKEAEICPKCGVNRTKLIISEEVYCYSCGERIKNAAEICPHCGVKQVKVESALIVEKGISKKDWTTTFILSLLLGGFGIDRLYVGKIGTGIIKMLTLGGVYIWWLIDWITVLAGKFTDKEGNFIKKRK
jgi:TM2 domain-containing membrane protein YozV/RNA polymerase subunit RPABC4/transcription elongation factor Spt4